MLTLFSSLINLTLAEPLEGSKTSTESSATTTESEVVESGLDNPIDVEQLGSKAAGVPVRIQLHNGVILEGSVPLTQLVMWSPEGTAVLTFTTAQQVIELQSSQVRSIEQLTLSAEEPDVDVPQEEPEKVSVQPESESLGSSEAETTGPVMNANGFSFANPAASRYLYAPSSIGLQKGQGYVSQKLLFMSGVYALTDSATILVGTLVPIPLVSVLGAKISKSLTPDLHVSVGVESFFLPFSGLVNDGGVSVPLTIGYAGVTKGDLDSHISVSTGVIYEDIFSNGNFVYPVMIAGHQRMTDRLAIVSENWMVLNTDVIQDGRSPYQASITSLAFRLVGQRDSTMQVFGQMLSDNGYPRYTWDIGLIMLHFTDSESITDPISEETYYSKYSSNNGFGPFPWVDFTWHFGPARVEQMEAE